MVYAARLHFPMCWRRWGATLRHLLVSAWQQQVLVLALLLELWEMPQLLQLLDLPELPELPVLQVLLVLLVLQVLLVQTGQHPVLPLPPSALQARVPLPFPWLWLCPSCWSAQQSMLL